MTATATVKRRTKTKFPGIYRSVSGKYEIAYRDSDGRLVFKTIGDLEEAKTARAELVTRMKRGEEVSSTRQTLAAFADEFVSSLNRRPRTLEKHRYHLRRHLLPRFGRRRIAEIRTSDVARMVAEMERAGYAGSTITGTLATLSLLCRKAKVRNPVAGLERDDRPTIEAPEKRVLDQKEIEKILRHAGSTFRPLVALMIFTGLRVGEALGLTWDDVDFGHGVIRVRYQLDRQRARVALKSNAGRRDVVLVPQLAHLLLEHRLASPHSLAADFVFAAADGRGRAHRSTSRGVERAVERAGLGDGISSHSFRHTFASLLIVGLKYDPVSVSKQLGHRKASFTQDTYAHLFDRVRHEAELRERLEQGFGHLLVDVNAVSTSGRNEAQLPAADAAVIPLASG